MKTNGKTFIILGIRDLVLMGQKYRHGNCVAGNRNTGTVYSRNFILEKQEESAVNLNLRLQ